MEALKLKVVQYRSGIRFVVMGEIDPALSGQSAVVFGPDTREACEEFVLSTMTDREAVGYWNILQMDARMIRTGDDGGKHDRHVVIMDRILTERGIGHEAGALTKAAA